MRMLESDHQPSKPAAPLILSSYKMLSLERGAVVVLSLVGSLRKLDLRPALGMTGFLKFRIEIWPDVIALASSVPLLVIPNEV